MSDKKEVLKQLKILRGLYIKDLSTLQCKDLRPLFIINYCILRLRVHKTTTFSMCSDMFDMVEQMVKIMVALFILSACFIFYEYLLKLGLTLS